MTFSRFKGEVADTTWSYCLRCQAKELKCTKGEPRRRRSHLGRRLQIQIKIIKKSRNNNLLHQCFTTFRMNLGLFPYQGRCQGENFKMKFAKRLSNFNFQWTKTSYQNNFKHIAFFFALFKGYNCNKLYERKGSNWSQRKQTSLAWCIMIDQISQNEILCMTNLPVFSQFLWSLKFIFSGSGKKLSLVLLQITNYIYSSWKVYKRMRYGLKYSGGRFLSPEN